MDSELPGRHGSATSSALPSTSLNEATELLFTAREQLPVDDVVLWLRTGGALITEATTVTTGSGTSVDIPVGMGIAGRALADGAPILVKDFQDTDELERRELRMQQPHVVQRQGWRSAVYAPLPFPRDAAVIACYSRTPNNFDSSIVNSLVDWGEKALLSG